MIHPRTEIIALKPIVDIGNQTQSIDLSEPFDAYAMHNFSVITTPHTLDAKCLNNAVVIIGNVGSWFRSPRSHSENCSRPNTHTKENKKTNSVSWEKFKRIFRCRGLHFWYHPSHTRTHSPNSLYACPYLCVRFVSVSVSFGI